MPFQVGQRVGDYEILQMLGAGGMGHVYRVRNIISNRMEAMKVLLPDLTAEPDLATRFISEIRTLASFDHPNIAQLHTALQADNQLIMMMEYVEGYTLEQMAGQRTLPLTEVAGYISQALSALAYAHERSVVHRDIKPANLMVTSHGVVKLMDFGIAKSNVENNNHTKPGTTMGSLYYMSPEQVRGSGVDPRSDLYSVGIVLYELLAGRRPFEADTTFSILNQQLNVLPQPPIEVNPSLPQGMNQVILRALAKDPAHRFRNAEEFRSALKPFITAPNGQEVMQPIAPMPQPAPAPEQGGYGQQPYTQQPYAQTPPPAYGNQQQWQQTPVPRSGGGKAIWITTGAIAAVLALAAAGFALPHFLKKTTSASTATSSSTPETAVNTSAPKIDTAPAPGTEALPAPGAVTNSAPSSPTAAPITAGHGPAVTPKTANVGRGGTQQGYAPNGAAPGYGPAPANGGNAAPVPAANNAELEQAEERLTQLRARANSAQRQVGQIRSQQEAMGLGLRGDIESAESRLSSYMQAANNDVGRGNATGASRNLDKADAELATIEKFLGR